MTTVLKVAVQLTIDTDATSDTRDTHQVEFSFVPDPDDPLVHALLVKKYDLAVVEYLAQNDKDREII